MRRDNVLKISEFGSLNTTEIAQNIDSIDVADNLNCMFNNTASKLVKRPTGTKLQFPGTSYYVSNFSPPVIITAYPTNYPDRVYTFIADGTNITIFVDTVVLQTYANTGTILSGLTYNNKTYLNMSNGMFIFDLAINTPTVTAGPSTFTVIKAHMFKERMFCQLGANNLANYLYFSDPGTPNIVQNNSFIQIGTDTGSITGIQSVGADRLLIFKTNSTYVLYVQGNDPQSWDLKLLYTNIGAKQQEAIVTFENIVYFVHDSKIYATDGTSRTPVYISAKVDKSINIPYAFTNTEADNNIACGVYNRHIIFSINRLNVGGLNTNLTLVYSVDSGFWYKWLNAYGSELGNGSAGTGIHNMSVCPVNSSNANIRKGLIGYYGVRVSGTTPSNQFYMLAIPLYFVQDNLVNPNLNAERLDYKVKTKKYDFGMPETFKRFKQVHVLVTGQGTLTFNIYNQNLIYTASQTVTANFGQAQVIKFKVFRMLKSAQFELVYTTETSDTSILEISCIYSMKDTTAKGISSA